MLEAPEIPVAEDSAMETTTDRPVAEKSGKCCYRTGRRSQSRHLNEESKQMNCCRRSQSDELVTEEVSRQTCNKKSDVNLCRRESNAYDLENSLLDLCAKVEKGCRNSVWW